MKQLQDILVREHSPVRDAIQRIDTGALHIALVVGNENRLLGTVTDGDVRRGLLRGVSLDDPVERVMNRTPVTVSVGEGRPEALRLMREMEIHQVPVVDPEGRVVGLETHDEWLSREPAETWVVLMVGGLGKRLRPLTDETPKPLLKVGGRPLIETIVQSFASQGFRNFFLSVNYRAQLFEAHFGDGEQHGVSIDYLHEDQQLGTAGALRLLPGRAPGPLIVMNGDLLTSVDFRHLLAFHRAQGSVATMCVRDYNFDVPYGVALIEDHRLIGLSEKPRHHFFVNAGIYVLEPEALDLIPPDGAFHMTQLFQMLIDQERATTVFPIREYWLDIGQVADLERAQGDFQAVFR